jgi:N-acyl-D-aspartate/D-glutamate deacylase
VKEREAVSVSGWGILVLDIAIFALATRTFIMAFTGSTVDEVLIVAGSVLTIVGVVIASGFTQIEPNIARVIIFLGRYVRDQKVTTLQDAVRRLTRQPATTFKLKDRGCLDKGCFADIVVFDPAKINDLATFDKPHQYAVGMLHVFVNGTQVLRDGEHTGAKPGQVVRGPGWVGWKQ